MTDIQGLIFDKDGTLFDFSATWSAWARALLLDLAGQEAERAARLGEAIGFDLATGQFAPDSPVIAGTPGEIAETLLPHVPGASPLTLVSRMNALAAAAPQVAATDLPALFGALKARGLRLGLATNDAEGPARSHLAEAGIEGLFDFIAGFDSGHGAKPGPGQLLAFADQIGVAPGRIAMVGDSRHDLHAARAAGMRGVGVLTGLAGTADLDPLAEIVLPDISHLPRWLDDMAACPDRAEVDAA
ncbi:HAD family hydrolase [Frigidibacter sp. MR17.14]|uniref:HAD family hydrolase n=1 Tax=Frigidibacter sp. MR17.14 TaxID=3126509 RepID=UPI003012DA9D